MQLDLLGHPQVLVEQAAEAVAAGRPGLDLEDQHAVVLAGAELDLTGLEVPAEGGQAERRRAHLHRADRPVPGPGHADHVLVAGAHPAGLAAGLDEGRELARRGDVRVLQQAGEQLPGRRVGVADPGPVAPVEERPDAVLRPLDACGGRPGGQRRHGRIGGGRAALAAVQRRGAPHVAPRGEGDADRPAGHDADAAAEGDGRGCHAGGVPAARPRRSGEAGPAAG